MVNLWDFIDIYMWFSENSFMRELPSLVKGVRYKYMKLRNQDNWDTSSLRGPWVQIPSPASKNISSNLLITASVFFIFSLLKLKMCHHIYNPDITTIN